MEAIPFSTTKPPPPPPSSKKKDCCCKLADELREAVHKAVLELPDDDEEESPKNKAAYLKAYQTCKSVVHQESDPVRFVQLEEWNIKNAAERLVINWSIRLQLFGPERAFLPLNDMSGNGALSQDDIDLLQQGYIGLLNNDRRGRSVLWVHNSKASETVRTKQAGPSRARNMFFLCTIAAMQQQPFCIWRYTDTPRFFDKASAGRIRQLLEAIPIQLDAFYFISLAPVAGAKRVFSNTMAPLIKQYLGPRIGGVMQSHVSENVQELCQIMLSSEGGLPLSSIPECLGGGYSDANFKEWMQRKRIEQQVHNEDDDDKKPAAVVLKQHSAEPKLLQEDDNSKSKEDLSQRVVVVAAEKACRRSNEEEQRKARKRKNDMMYARERRRRERQLGDSLKVKCDELRQSNALLREEGHRLETLLSLAKKTSSSSSSSSQQEKMAPPPPLQEPVAQRQRLMVASAPAQGNGGVALAQQQLVLQQQQQQQLLMRQQQQQMSRLNSGGGGGGLGQFPPQFLAARRQQSLVQSTLSPQLANRCLEQRNNFSSSSSLLLGSSSGITPPPPPLSQANGGGGAGGGEDRAVLLRRQLLLEALRREGQTIDVLNSMVVRR